MKGPRRVFFVLLTIALHIAFTMALSSTGKQRIPWIVRSPSLQQDKEAIESLFQSSYGELLRPDYDQDVLEKALPIICTVREELFTSPTWYVVEHPTEHTIVGCGGWTPQSPMAGKNDENDNNDISNTTTCPHLRHFATHPRYTRQGIARALWDRTWNDWCEYHRLQNSTHNSSQYPRPDMEVFSTITAQSFYASLGFETIQEITIPLAEDCAFPSILMRRPDTGENNN